ncbi:unnamed protein product [Didymodactylos carnosus]|uniref:G-protein coupled receptors family 1 profile domain-containing protein n=1 Tax=Didymodactylos carnosus TaxID=1234261 RepID=A0A8S2IGZ4_9BILA|nr:unnamed protein product [Didymodactylos carnosus]CAF3731361.1 unnamed protein product [Didymodactylos carnosus]
MTSSNLFTGFLIYNLDFCCAWGLLYDMFECSIYHSYCLQAFYRLCRVVFYNKKSLLSYLLYIILIIGQWLLTFFLLLPPVFLKWYSQLPAEKYCLVPYTDINAEIYHIIILYIIPLVCITTTYLWITIFIHRSSYISLITAVKQRQRNLRDLTVIKRIIILILMLVVLRFPTIIFMIHAATIGHLYSLTYDIVGLITSTCLIFVGLITIHITPQLRKNISISLIHRNNRLHVQQIPLNHLKMSPTMDSNVTTIRQNKLTNTQEDDIAEQNP